MFWFFCFRYFINPAILKKTAMVLFTSDANRSSSALFYLKVIQTLFWFVGAGLLLSRLFLPSADVTLFWNILIPVAPALLVVATGVWRNICHLATTALIPDRSGFSKKKKLSSSLGKKMNPVGVIALLLIIPLRHVLCNTSRQATSS